jgi:HEAT repeat protein
MSGDDSEETPEEETPEDEAPEEEAPEDEAPEDEAPEDETPEDETPEDETPEDEETAPATAVTVESLRERLDAIEERLETAETEDDLDQVEAEIEDLEADLDGADLPEAEDEDEEDPTEEIESEKEGLESQLEEQRGPTAEDVVADIEEAESTVADTEWTERGEGEVAEAVESFVESVDETLDESVTVASESIEDLTAALEDAGAAVETADLDPDDDADAVAALLEASEELLSDLDDAEKWSDLSVREQLQTQGFYDVLDHRKDYPPEWGALKVWTKRGRADMVLLALEKLESEFMEEHCLDMLKRLGPEEAVEPMLQRAGKRDQDAIEILGKIGDEEAVDTLVEYVGEEGNPNLQKVTMKALGEIGSRETTQAVADNLVADDEEIRSHAARTLGLLGDTRAIEPLADVLEDDESNTVRASAAWALNQIGTERALNTVAEYADDRAYLVQSEAEKAV